MNYKVVMVVAGLSLTAFLPFTAVSQTADGEQAAPPPIEGEPDPQTVEQSSGETTEAASEQESLPAEPRALEDGGRLELICGGGGSANRPDVITGSGDSTWTSPYGNAYGSSNVTVYGTRSQQFADETALYIQGDEGRIRMPPVMLPAIRGGEDGWFKLSSIKIKPNEITATVKVNFMNNPKLRIDRVTGAISISGKAGNYTGRCQRFVAETAERQF